MRIIDLGVSDSQAIEQVASIVVEAFREHWPEAWPNMEAALEEVAESFEPGRISRIAVDDGTLLVWIGGIPHYRGRVWELHPLVVSMAHQREGIGRALVADFEEQLRTPVPD